MYKKLSRLTRFTIVAGLLVTASFYTRSLGAALNLSPLSYICTGSSTSGNDSYPTDEDNPISISDPGVLQNDCTTDFPPNPTLDVSSINDITTGVLTMPNPSGSGGFDYDPNGQFEDLAQGESTSDSFTYDVTDTITTVTNTVTITIDGVNDPPTDISLSASSIAEHLPSGTTVGTFTTTDPDTSDTHIYSLVAGTGDVDNTSFTISGDALQSAEEFNYETKDTYNIRVQTDDGNSTFPKEFIITITDANDPPEVQNPIPDQNAAVDNLFTFTFTADSFIDLNSDPLTYTASKSDDTPLPVWLTFEPGTRTFTGTPDVNDSGILSVKVTADDGNGGSVSDIFDIIIAGFIFSPSSGLVTSEGGIQATFNVELATQPTLAVAIGFSSDDTTEGTVPPSVLLFDDTNWDQQQSVSIDGVDDSIIDGDIPYNILTTITTSDSNYSLVDLPDLSVTNQDDDIAGFTIIPTTGLITSEGGIEAELYIELDTEPAEDVKVTLYSDDTSEGTVSPISVTFTAINWDIPKTITVTGVDDDMADGPKPFKIITDPAESLDPDYSNFNPPDVSVTNSDNDSPGYTIAPLSGLFTTEGGGSVKVNILLQSRPTSDVTLTFISTDLGEGTVDPKSLIVKEEEWASDKIYKFTITGVDDDGIDKPEDMQYNVNVSSSSADTNYDDFTQILIVENKDAPNITWVEPVTDGLVHEVDNLVPFYIEVEPASIEPIGKVTFYRWDDTLKEYRDIGVVTSNPYRVILNPADLNWEWNQVYAYASPPASSVTSKQPWIWIFRGELVYRSFMPFLMK